MFDPRPLTATVDRRRLLDALDFVADAAAELELLGGDPDVVKGLRAVIADVAADLEAADALDGHGHPDDAVEALAGELAALDDDHLDAREHLYGGLATLGAAVPPTCHACGVALRATSSDTGWGHPRTDCYYARRPRPTDRRASAELMVRVTPEYAPSVERSGGDLHVHLASHHDLAGITLTVAVPVAAARRWAIRLAAAVGKALPAVPAAPRS
jgi:hypothetical protein